MNECPHPWKRKLLSRKEAKKFRKHGNGRETTKLSSRVRPYKCVCGFWHLGHLPDAAVKYGRKTIYG